MAFFPIYHYRRYDNPLDRYFGDQLDFFDPWYDLNTSPTTLVIIPNDFRWVNEPEQQANSAGKTKNADQTSRAPNSEKFRVQLNVAGFKPETIKTKVEGRKIIIEAKQEDRQPDGDYHIRELRKSYELPEHADANHLASYITPHHMLVIEVPIQNPEAERRVTQGKNQNQNLAQFGQHRDPSFDYNRFLTGSNFNSKIVDKGDNQKQLEMSIEMKNYQPNEIKVSVKNNELIVKGERQHKDENRSERVFFFKSTTLPPGTQTEQLQSYLTEDGQLKIAVPYVEATKPIEEKKESNKSTEQQNETNKTTEEQKK
jgi:HSP20 family molecular chaperone IbpA